MAINLVLAELARYGLADRVTLCAASSATVALAAEAVGCEPARIVKTLSFDVGGVCTLIACSGDARVDNAKYKAYFGVKAKMLSAEAVEAATGHAVGGVCPFGVPAGVRVCLDQSIRRFDTVYPAAGAHNAVARLTVAELERVLPDATWVDVCKRREDDA